MSKKKKTTRKRAKAGKRSKARDESVRDDKFPVRVTGSGRKLTESRLEKEAFLRLHVHDLPYEYSRFMLKHNGGDPEPAHFVFQHERGPQLSWVDEFYPITGSEIDVLNLRGANRRLNQMAIHVGVPYDCITIGSSGGGHEDILLFVRGRRRGQVWLKVWDDVSMDVNPDRDTNPNEGLYKLANSFNEFLAMLCTEEEAERRVQAAGRRKRRS